MKPTVNKTEFQKKITDSMMSAFESVIKKKAEYYSNNNTSTTLSNQSSTDVTKIISKCGNTNAVISGGAGLIPGIIGTE